MNDNEVRIDIEAHVDRLGLAHFLGLLADVCDSKYEHLNENWQDKRTAVEWEAARKLIVSVADRVNV